MTDIDLDELRSELDDYAKPAKAEGGSAKEQRILAGFEEIERFVEQHGRPPQHGEDRDIFERLYAVRLDRLRASAECRAVLQGRDPHGLLSSTVTNITVGNLHEDPPPYGGEDESTLSDDELAAELREAQQAEADIRNLQHVRSTDEIRAAEEIAKRTPCRDFEQFRPVFEMLQRDLETRRRQTVKYKDNAEVKKGDVFILDGQKVLVAELGEEFVGEHGRPDRRLRVIYDNGTESDLLLRSLQRALNKDKTSRRVTEPDFGPLFSGEVDDEDLPSGQIYVLRSKSEHPFVAENRTVLHKIGVTSGEVKTRIANAKKDPTYLLADVDVIATFKLANIDRKRLEALLHRFFSAARLDLELKDRFGANVEPREWFLLPLPVIEEAVKRIMDGSIQRCLYDPDTASIVNLDHRAARDGLLDSE